MRSNAANTVLLSLILCLWTATANIVAGTLPDAGLIKAKKEAESGGSIFLTNREEIVAKARKEGRLRVLSSLDPETFRALSKAFTKQYPFIDLHIEELKGTDAPQRFLLELQGRGGTNWDVFDVAPEFYQDFIPHVKKFDVLGMARQGVLPIPANIIDPRYRNVVSIASSIFGIAYNKNLIAAERVPNAWEDFLKPEFKGRKFMVDIRPQGFAALAAGLGEEWAMDYAQRIKGQDPIWVRGQSRALAAMTAGEQSMLHLVYYHSCMRARRKDSSRSLECKVIEPVPARIQEMTAIGDKAPNPHASLLWVEFQISTTGQRIIDEFEPLKSSVYVPGSELAKVTQGKKMSVNNWETFHNSAKWEQMAIKAFGFPQAGLK